MFHIYCFGGRIVYIIHFPKDTFWYHYGVATGKNIWEEEGVPRERNGMSDGVRVNVSTQDYT